MTEFQLLRNLMNSAMKSWHLVMLGNERKKTVWRSMSTITQLSAWSLHSNAADSEWTALTIKAETLENRVIDSSFRNTNKLSLLKFWNIGSAAQGFRCAWKIRSRTSWIGALTEQARLQREHRRQNCNFVSGAVPLPSPGWHPHSPYPLCGGKLLHIAFQCILISSEKIVVPVKLRQIFRGDSKHLLKGLPFWKKSGSSDFIILSMMRIKTFLSVVSAALEIKSI